MPRNAVAEARLGGHRLEADEIQNALCLVVIFIVCIAFSWLPFVSMGYDPLDSLFEVVSAIATAGLSAGITDAALHPLLKAVLGVDMLLGRLEIFAWLILLTPGTWIGRRLEG
jgi:trk system potassium uptake protein TrkH